MVKYFVPQPKPAARLHPLLLGDSRKLRALQTADPLKQWWAITETRFCAQCEHLFIGREIRFYGEDDYPTHFGCPTPNCDGGFADWQYPQLHL